MHLGVATRSSTKWDCFHQYTRGLQHFQTFLQEDIGHIKTCIDVTPYPFIFHRQLANIPVFQSLNIMVLQARVSLAVLVIAILVVQVKKNIIVISLWFMKFKLHNLSQAIIYMKQPIHNTYEFTCFVSSMTRTASDTLACNTMMFKNLLLLNHNQIRPNLAGSLHDDTLFRLEKQQIPIYCLWSDPTGDRTHKYHNCEHANH
jgi:hypothetical protein